MIKKDVMIKTENGLHTRLAAMLVNKASELKSRYNTEFFIKRKDDGNFMAVSMLALISLKIHQYDVITLACEDNTPNGIKALDEIENFLNEDLLESSPIKTKVDEFIEENTIANEQILDNVPIGIIVVDSKFSIIKINKYALDIVDKTYSDVLGKFVKDIIPTTELVNTVYTGQKQVGQIQHINNHIIMTNRSPIINEGKIIGAIGVFQDVSDLVGMKELNEKFKKILAASHDLICFVDESRKITYINPSYEKNFNVVADNILGKDLIEIAPNGLRMQVFNSKEKLENVIWEKDGVEIISTLEPLFIDNKFKGVISTSKAISEIKDLMLKLKKFEDELTYYKEELFKHTEGNSNFRDIIGRNSSLKSILNICEKASMSTSTVLIRGESGTGKELIAKAIHNNSPRRNKPFVRVNCAAIPENLLESELFGYEKGAFTGAIKDKPGKFMIANEGTIFLDEIGDMPISMQVKLLRALQEKEIESIGGLSPKKVDVRIIAATNRPLEEMIEEKTFREDLYYRLNVLSILLPPLRDRRDDIPLLSDHFLIKLSKELNKDVIDIDDEALNLLKAYDWPGNIRELQNIIERAINLCDGNIITCRDLPSYIKNIDTASKDVINTSNGEILPFEEYEKRIIELAMKKYGSFNKAGKALGLTHRTVSLKCKKYGILID